MAKRDAREYFKQIEQQYFEIKELTEDVKEYYEKGEMSEEQLKDQVADFERASIVYDTARIFMHQLNKKKDKDTNQVVDLPQNFNIEEVK